MNTDSFGVFLYELRRRRGLSQKRLGELLGVSGKAVSKWECGLSMPQSNMLPRLADMLNVTLDELLSCGWENSRKGKDEMKNEFWNRVDAAAQEKYGENPPLAVVNRLNTERNDAENPAYYFAMKIFCELKELADSTGHRFTVYGYHTYTFATYLLGLSPVNPLPAHYYCPNCGTIAFSEICGDGYDLPQKSCSCGSVMQRDGHNIPAVPSLRPHEYYGIQTDRVFRETAADFLRAYPGSEETPLMNNANEFHFAFHNPTVFIRSLFMPIREAMHLLERGTNTSTDRIDFLSPDVLGHLMNADCKGIPDIGTEFSRQMIRKCNPKSFAQLAKITGMTHSVGLWIDNGEELLKSGISLNQLVTCRDDIYCTVRDAMLRHGYTDFGFAVSVMENARRGRYLKNGMSESDRTMLLELGLPEWFPDSISKCKYLFEKADSIRYTRDFLIFQWYKLNYPAVFEETMKIYEELNARN